MRERKKAQDIFNETNFVFSSKTTFEKAFPQIKDISVVVTEMGTGVRGNYSRSYNKHYLSEYINCSNSLCYNGGFSIGSIIRDMVYKKEIDKEGSEMCQGNEGSPKGRRIYRKCVNIFKYKIHIDYNVDMPSQSSK